MIFNDLAFIALFLPLVMAAFLLAPARAREPALIAASLVFYGLAGTEHVLVLAGCVAWVWGVTRGAAMVGSRWRLLAAVAGPLAALAYYKYLGFVVRDVLGLAPAEGWLAVTGDKLLPAGISFFTFHLVSFSIDRFRGAIADQPTLRHFTLYIAFFPHLVAGPILRYHNVVGALENLTRFRPAARDWHLAIGHFCCGLAAKVLLADGLSHYIQPLTHAPGALSPAQAAFVAAAYSFQIYFDFWGYSLMAIGLAHLFGFRFPRNFDRPYDALNPRDFWRRWHVTLSQWFRDYLYIPLGGNARYVPNILIVFTVCGLWHGAAWQFLVWGLYHGLLIVLYHAVRPAWDRLPRLLQRSATFALVALGWTLFLFDFGAAWAILHSLVGLGQGAGVPALRADAWAMLAIAAAACYLIDVDRLLAPRSSGKVAELAISAGFAMLFVLAVIFIDRSNSFIYFRF